MERDLYRIFSKERGRQHNGSTIGNPLPKHVAEQMMEILQAKEPDLEYWVERELCATSRLSQSRPAATSNHAVAHDNKEGPCATSYSQL